MSDVQQFEARRGLASACKSGSTIEVYEGADGTFLLLFTMPRREVKTVPRLSMEAFARLTAIGLRLLSPKMETRPPEVTP